MQGLQGSHDAAVALPMLLCLCSAVVHHGGVPVQHLLLTIV